MEVAAAEVMVPVGAEEVVVVIKTPVGVVVAAVEPTTTPPPPPVVVVPVGLLTEPVHNAPIFHSQIPSTPHITPGKEHTNRATSNIIRLINRTHRTTRTTSSPIRSF